MRIATYNVEWFNALFDDMDQPARDDTWSGRYNVTKAQQWNALALVFQTLDADAVLVVEAPDGSRKRSTTDALENFAAITGIRARSAITGHLNHTQQELALLYDPDALTATYDPQAQEDAPAFDTTFKLDIDVDRAPERIEWSKPPLELALTTAKGTNLRLIGVHAKSKAPHGARDAADAMRLSIANRRKQLAQCIWLRRRVDHHLAAGDALIVAGDFNDGPGLDRFERLFGRSGVEIVMGAEGEIPMHDPHAAAAPPRPGGAQYATARFFDRKAKRYFSALLDFLMLSPDLMAHAPQWRILHPFDDPACYGNPALCQALLTASDHFPVLIDIDI